MAPLIDASDLAALVAAGRRVRLLDVRWRLDEPEGRPRYLDGHLPGASYVELETELARRGHPEEGSHPLPSAAQLTQAARRWGIRRDDLIIAYDDNDSVAAARAWWLLRAHGLDVRVLDGGLREWVRSGGALVRGDHVARPSDIELTTADPGVVHIDEVPTIPLIGTLVDARGPDHYRGRASGVDPATGHIPGAINVPAVSHIDADGRLKSREAITQTLLRAGVRIDGPVVLYCGSGIASAHSALAFELVGIRPRIYAGSWSQWSRSAGRAMAVGPTPRDHVLSV